MEERHVLHDCHSDQVRALIEEHNKLVDALIAHLAGQPPTIMPRKIIVRKGE